MHKLILGE